MSNCAKEIGEVFIGRRVITRVTTENGCLRKSSSARTDERLSSEINRLV